jgi:hypothetical protein
MRVPKEPPSFRLGLEPSALSFTFLPPLNSHSAATMRQCNKWTGQKYPLPIPRWPKAKRLSGQTRMQPRSFHRCSRQFANPDGQARKNEKNSLDHGRFGFSTNPPSRSRGRGALEIPGGHFWYSSHPYNKYRRSVQHGRRRVARGTGTIKVTYRTTLCLRCLSLAVASFLRVGNGIELLHASERPEVERTDDAGVNLVPAFTVAHLPVKTFPATDANMFRRRIHASVPINSKTT